MKRIARASSTLCRGRALPIAALCLLLLGGMAAAQQTPPPPSATAHRPGMLDSMGRWFSDAWGRLSGNVDTAREQIDRAGGAAREATQEAAQETARVAREAAETMARLPHARVIEGRARCTVAENGAPDCRKAAESVCKGKGFKAGASLDIRSEQKCAARAWLGRGEPGDCELQSFVVKAVCQ